MFVAPYYNKHNNLEIMNGIIDTDLYHEAHINSFFTAPMGEEVTLEYGMPICQVIPFKREDYEMEVLTGDHRSMHNKVTQFIHNSLYICNSRIISIHELASPDPGLSGL